MASFMILMIFVLICPYVELVSSNETLTLVPHTNMTHVMFGSMLTLKCVYESFEKNTSNPDFYYSSNYSISPQDMGIHFEDYPHNGFTIDARKTEVNEISRITMILTKVETNHKDAGSYECRMGNLTDITNVYIFEETLTLVPHTNMTHVMFGSMLALKCVYESFEKNTSNPDFYYSSDYSISPRDMGIQIKDNYNGFTIDARKTEVNETSRITMTLTKVETNHKDAGSYECRMGNLTDITNVYIFEETLTLVPHTNMTHVMFGSMLALKCVYESFEKNTSNPDFYYSSDYSISPRDMGIQIKDNYNGFTIDARKTEVNEISRITMILTKVETNHKDAGSYECRMGNLTDITNVYIFEETLTLVPHTNMTHVMFGSMLALKCVYESFEKNTSNPNFYYSSDYSISPQDMGIQIKDNYNGFTIDAQKTEVNETSRVTIILTKVETNHKDAGSYECRMGNLTDITNVYIFEVFRDKLAALWPFLGIVAEVIILCTFILIYEKRRSKKWADVVDAADNNLDNTGDHEGRDVRHRKH